QTCNSRLSKHTRNSRLSKSGMFQGCESTQVGQFLNRAATDWAVRLRQTEASAKVGEQCALRVKLSWSTGQQIGWNPCAKVPCWQALQVGVSRRAIQGCPAARNPQLWNRPDLRHV
ncbi:MAG TPA: hypothetical protein VFX23_09905, partial [Limnobacter sp.]|uniref:hypothetical protein n=1 Tax=Limnobacter sp. TaxID=2003368 RepID=UPI002E2EFF89